MSPTRPTILFVTNRLANGGAERHLVRIANVLAADHDVHIAVLRRGGSYEALTDRSIPIHHVSSRWAHRSTLVSATLATGRLAKLISDTQPQCILSFLESASYATHRALKRLSLTTPHLVAIQNNFARTIAVYRRWIDRGLLEGFIDSIKTASGVIAISKGVQQELVERFPQIEARISMIHNAAFEKLPDDPPVVVGLTRKPAQLVACGRLVEQKGYPDLLAAFQIVRQRVDAGLWIMGTGPMEAELRELARSLGVADHVQFLGFKTDPIPTIASADVFVLSSWWEGFGNVIVEAMSAGTPVVATDCPHGPNEIITPEHDGILVPINSPQRLASQLIRVLDDPVLQSKLSSQALIRASDFTAAKIGADYARVIQKVTRTAAINDSSGTAEETILYHP